MNKRDRQIIFWMFRLVIEIFQNVLHAVSQEARYVTWTTDYYEKLPELKAWAKEE